MKKKKRKKKKYNKKKKIVFVLKLCWFVESKSAEIEF